MEKWKNYHWKEWLNFRTALKYYLKLYGVFRNQLNSLEIKWAKYSKTKKKSSKKNEVTKEEKMIKMITRKFSRNLLQTYDLNVSSKIFKFSESCDK